DVNESDLLSFAYSLENKSEHPLAKAVVKKAESERLTVNDTVEFEAVSGKGIKAQKDGKACLGGSLSFISGFAEIPDEVRNIATSLSKEGKTPLFFAEDKKLLGIIAVADVIREESPKAIARLKKMGINVVMLTGDNEETARAIGNQAGADEVIAGVLPDEKQKVILELRKKGRVAMVGDGINDAPALTAADTGIAVGAGTDIAIDAANVVLMKSNPDHIPDLINLSRHTLRNIHQNLFWAFFYNVLCIPLATGIFTPIFGWELNPMLGAAAMSLSSFCVVSNALRLKSMKFK
ncbi:MAG: HAD-IC family P-type ATPase, partial [Clostridia bacterium]|nr:HAD-IC family P-type ATPase [Clostridia bacterium]